MNQYINKFSNFIGKDDVKENLKIFINSSIKEKRQLEHCLIFGLPGMGKTTLAKIIANELNTNIKIAQGSLIERPINVINLLLSLSKGDIIFIDEIHQIKPVCFELFYSAMEEGYIDINVGKDFNTKIIRLKLPDFTLIGATTILGKIPQPLEDRFGIKINLGNYSQSEMENIAYFYKNKLKLNLTKSELSRVIESSKGTPRIVYMLLRRIKDFKLHMDNANIDEILKRLGYIYKSYSLLDYKYLTNLIKTKGFVGIKTLTQSLNLDERTIITKIEPHLLINGIIEKTINGRKITTNGKNIYKILSKIINSK